MRVCMAYKQMATGASCMLQADLDQAHEVLQIFFRFMSLQAVSVVVTIELGRPLYLYPCMRNSCNSQKD